MHRPLTDQSDTSADQAAIDHWLDRIRDVRTKLSEWSPSGIGSLCLFDYDKVCQTAVALETALDELGAKIRASLEQKAIDNSVDSTLTSVERLADQFEREIINNLIIGSTI